MEFVLFEKFKELETNELVWLIAGIVVMAALIVILVMTKKAEKPAGGKFSVRALVQGALCLSMAFVLSYVKLFSMPLGGSVTLCSMLPIALYAWAWGPVYGLTVGFAYSLLQVIQGAWIVHPIQFILDYILAFTVLGISAFFPKRLPLAVAAACIARFLCSMLAGAVFYADSAVEAGFASPWIYAIAYNGATIGVEAVLCVVVSLLSPVKKVAEQMRRLKA